MRAVLITIADAANRDGEHAHPGLTAMIEGSLYGRAHVLATVKKLVDDRWVEIEEEGGGRGHATVYRVCMERTETVQPVDRSDDPETVQPVDRSSGKGSNPDRETVQSGGSTLSSATDSTEIASDRSHPEYGWDRFWNAYPRRDGRRGDKGKTLAIWRRMSYDHKAEAWRQLREYQQVVAAGRPAMDAQRWLRQGVDVGWDPQEGWSAAQGGRGVSQSSPAGVASDPHERAAQEAAAQQQQILADWTARYETTEATP